MSASAKNLHQTIAETKIAKQVLPNDLPAEEMMCCLEIQSFLINLSCELLNQYTTTFDENITLHQYLSKILQELLTQIDNKFLSNSIIAALKVPINQSLSENGEQYTDPTSTETALYLFSHTSQQLKQGAQTPPRTEHSKIFRKILSTNEAFNSYLGDKLPSFCSAHPIMKSMYLSPITLNGMHVGLIGIANAERAITQGVHLALQNMLPFIWRHAVLQTAAHYQRQKQLMQEKYLAKLYPKFIIDHLHEKNFNLTEDHTIDCKNVAVFFCDIKNFTASSNSLSSSAVLVKELGRYFALADVIAQKHGVEVIKTVGDCIIALGNLEHSASCGNPAAIINFALEFITKIKQHDLKIGSQAIEIRVGIDFGDVALGLVGFPKRKMLDLFGQTVNSASRYESTGEANKVHISLAMAKQLASSSQSLLQRNVVNLKGIGTVPSYFAPKLEHTDYLSKPSATDNTAVPMSKKELPPLKRHTPTLALSSPKNQVNLAPSIRLFGLHPQSNNRKAATKKIPQFLCKGVSPLKTKDASSPFIA